MNWYELAENPQAIAGIYRDVPSLKAVRLIEVSLNVRGPKMNLKIDLPRFPDNVPARWKLQGYNRIQLQLDFWILQSLQIEDWWASEKADIEISRHNDKQVRLQVFSPQLSLDGIAHDFRITIHKSILF